MPLTDAIIANLKPNGKQYEVWDGDIPSFGIRLSAKGKKQFVVMYRNAQGTTRRFTIGMYPIISLEQARTKACEVIAAVKLYDRDPCAERRAKRKRKKPTVRVSVSKRPI
jgi:hypothetical protein